MSDLTLVPDHEVTCPRCGAGNPPDRYTCLECGMILRSEQVQRPGCLMVYSFILLIAGAVSFMIGNFSIQWNASDAAFAIAGLIGGQIIGVVLMIAAYGVWTLQRWAHTLVTALLVIGIVIPAYSVAQVLLGQTEGGAPRSFLLLVVNVYTLYWFLTNRRVFR